MTLEEFQDLLDMHGTDLAHWPPAAARSARQLLDTDPRARARLAAAQRLASALQDTLRSVHASASLRLRLQRIPSHYPQLTRRPQATAFDLRRWLLGGAALTATAAALGFIAGFAGLLAPEAGVDWTGLAYGLMT